MVHKAGKDTSRVSRRDLAAFVRQVLRASGVHTDHAAIVADCLVDANLRGVDTHGVVRLEHYVRRLQNGTINHVPRISFERTGPSSGIVDGDDGLGHVVAHEAANRAMELAEESGNGTVAVRRSSHFGMQAFYLSHVAERGFAGMLMTSTDSMLVPHGARKAYFGTNPIAFGFPANDAPVILDMATTGVAFGNVALARVENSEIPAEWGLDADGNPTTDPHRIAGLHPMASYKGSGLAMVVDIFCALFSGMPFGPHIPAMYEDMDKRRHLGHFLSVWDVERFVPLATFKERIAEMIYELHELPTAAGHERVLYPGEPEAVCSKERERYGIPLEPGLLGELRSLGGEFGIELPVME